MPERKHTARYPAELRMRSSAVHGKSHRLFQRQRGLRLDRGKARMLPLHASRMVYPDGARHRRATGPERCRQGQDQGAGAREQGTAHRQRDPEEGVGLLCPDRTRPPVPQMIAFIEEHREAYGVEPVCCLLSIAPSTYDAHAAVAHDPGKASDWSKRDAEVLTTIKRVQAASKGRYGARNVWHKLLRKDRWTARRTSERLMRKHGLQGGLPGTQDNHNTARPCPQDQGQPEVQGGRPRSTLGRQLHRRAHRDGNDLCNLRHRRLRSENRRVAFLNLNDNQLRPRRPEPSHLQTTTGAGNFDLPLGPRHAVSVRPIRRTARRSRNRYFDRKRWKQLRQRPSRNRHQAVQEESCQTNRFVENHRPARMGSHKMVALVQQRPTAWSDQLSKTQAKRRTRSANKRTSLKKLKKSSLSVEQNTFRKTRGDSL